MLPPSRAEASWGRGAGGERIVGAARDAHAAQRQVVVLHERRLPRSRANIDHLAVTPGGAFTVDAKHSAGIDGVRVTPVLCWVGTQISRLLSPTQDGGVRLTAPRRLHAVLTHSDDALHAALRSRIVDVRGPALPPADDSDQARKRPSGQTATQNDAGSLVRQTSDDASSPSAQASPRCEGSKVLRSRHSDGARFLGCSAFPRCRGTLPLPGPDN